MLTLFISNYHGSDGAVRAATLGTERRRAKMAPAKKRRKQGQFREWRLYDTFLVAAAAIGCTWYFIRRTDKASTRSVTRTEQRPREIRPGKVQRRSGLFQVWRPLMFFVVAVVAVSIATYFKIEADPSSGSSQFVSGTPLILDVFVSNPQISLQVNNANDELLLPPGAQSVNATVEIPPHVGGRILVVSSAPGDVYNSSLSFKKMSPYNNETIPFSQIYELGFLESGYYVAVIKVKNAEDADLTETISLGNYFIQHLFDKTKDSIYGSLPSIEGINSPQIQSYSPPLLAELNDAHDIRDITPFPTSDLNKPPSQPSSYTTPHGGSPELFWIPKRFSVTETLGLAAQIFRNNEINYITPPGELIGDTYVWHANTALEPDFKVSNEDALANESNAAFLSGIFFGIAGAALIALIQEVPKESYRRISRRSHS